MLEKLSPEVFLNVTFYLSFDNVKKCREVSKSWQAQMENYSLFNSAVIVITPENENQYWKSKLLRFVNTLRITKFKNSKTDQSKYKGFLRLLAEKQSTNKHWRLECVSIEDFLLVDSSSLIVPFLSNISKIQLIGSTIVDSVLVELLNELFHKCDLSLETLLVHSRVINSTIMKKDTGRHISSSIRMIQVNVRIEIANQQVHEDYFRKIKIIDSSQKYYSTTINESASLNPINMGFLMEIENRIKPNTILKIELDGERSKSLFFRLMAADSMNVKVKLTSMFSPLYIFTVDHNVRRLSLQFCIPIRP